MSENYSSEILFNKFVSANRTKREYIGMGSDVKYTHSRKYIYQKEKCICGVPKWEVTLQKRKIDRRNVEVIF